MVIYPYLKRFTPLCHLWLGAVDGLAPVGAWVAVTGHFDPPRGCSGAAVACWIAGFDIIYATMDIEIDRAQGLHSIPADYGLAARSGVSRALHALSVVALAGVGLTLGLGPVYAIGVVAVAAAAGLRAAARLAERPLARQRGVPERQRRDRRCSISARSRSTSRSRDRRRASSCAASDTRSASASCCAASIACSSRAARSALLGPNGAGKSTLLRCIAGLLRPRAGRRWSTGRKAASSRRPSARRVAYAGHRPLLWGGLSARENLLLCAGLYGLGATPPSARSTPPASRTRRTAGPRALPGPAAAARPGSRAASRAGLLVLDEPHSGLDEASCARLDAVLAAARGTVTLSWRRTSAPAPSGSATSSCSSRCCAERAPRAVRRAVLLLVRTDLVLERRAPQLALAMALFAAVAQVVLHYGADIAGAARSR